MSEDLFQLTDYDFHLPEQQIAQHPADKRDASRLMILQPKQQVAHGIFSDIINYISPKDLLVVNNTKVFPARLYGKKASGGKVELFLLHFPIVLPPLTTSLKIGRAKATALLKSSKRPRPGSELLFEHDLVAEVAGYHDDGKVDVILHFPCSSHAEQEHALEHLLYRMGQIPLPPYIHRESGTTATDRERYQTLYARHTGSVAAPTAGLHFSTELLHQLSNQGISTAEVTLHVGYGTFAPVRTQDIRDHQIHSEHFTVSQDTADAINNTKEKGGKIWAVGTTTVRTLEYVAAQHGKVTACSGNCDLFIYPGHTFAVVDNLITNFHLPKSSLLFLVSALAGRQNILDAYREAVRSGYRFFSYGDAMAIIMR
ncbi:tRNA preQ1(34) S-adenosylmethionine ribosyltransferase-isomerase QueA [Desulfogranum japonicum]|uniref:tRNA preQ1(34) S-adenosylmethionine ribosyltransferase-isomerase QueA n=1 Tax=Desulfogranum japonicum TaxID=231447 RepID=UPI000427268D|nr:tRNA preQ1(34) S-adenosylmethionine ribosyltransferase-isomerase QueA [Desulfogranum japonicum]